MDEAAESGVEQLHALRRELPGTVEIWIGGQASDEIDIARFPRPACTCPHRVISSSASSSWKPPARCGAGVCCC